MQCRLVGLLLSVFFSISTLAAQRLETADLAEVRTQAETLAAQFGGPQQVMLVFDLDNTLLKHQQALGTDQWFRWQEDAVLNNKEIPERVAKDFNGLLGIQGVLFQLSPMQPTQPDGPTIVQELKAKGFAVIALTARGFDYRDVTFKHLNVGYSFSRYGYSGLGSHSFLPYDHKNLSSIGLSANQDPQWIKDLKLHEPARPVNFTDGVFFSGGQHKGTMLLAILHLTKLQPKAVIFVDDTQKHVDRVHRALEIKPIEVVTYRYSREDQVVADFEKPNSPDKNQAAFDWSRLKTLVREIFGQNSLPPDTDPTGVH